MATVYIVLLRNNYLLFSEKKPKKKGNYTQDVRLFKTKGSSVCEDVCKWIENDYAISSIKEITDWE